MALLVYFIYPRLDLASAEMKMYWEGKIENFMEDKNRSWKQRRFSNNEYDTPIDYKADFAVAKAKNNSK